jgi:predicted dienelactone hydrolase
MRKADLCVLVTGLTLLSVTPAANADPSGTRQQVSVNSSKVCDGTLNDRFRRRTLPVRVRMPAVSGSGPVPVILFSHGLGGSIDGGTAWGAAWAKAGFAVIHVQHPGSDRAIWIDQPTPEARREALKAGAAPRQLLARIADIRFVVNLVGTSQSIGTCSFSGLDPKRIGGAGHSFGAHTMLAVAGERYQVMGMTHSFPEPRLKAFIVLSGSPPQGARRLWED